MGLYLVRDFLYLDFVIEVEIMSNNKSRDLLFDNLKGFLILVVMLGHSFEFFIVWSKVPKLMDTTFFVIYCFHMPLFVFISGYFTKNMEKGKNEAFTRFFIPYVLFNLIYYIYF